MTELLTAAQMRSIEQAAIESGEVTGLELMERAGQGVVDAILDWRPELATTPLRAVVLCGPGNNGGDGFVISRLLHERGWDVEVFLYGDEAKLPPDAAANSRLARQLGLIPTSMEAAEECIGSLTRQDIVIDAIFGSGLSRPFDVFGTLQQLINNLVLPRNHLDGPWVVAIDVPSGLCADSGRYIDRDEQNAFSRSMAAHLTVTFHSPFVGHLLGEADQACGELRVCDIGLVPGTGKVHQVDVDETHLSKPPLQHKYDHGHALILSGGVGKGGAARLAARGALRIGAGLVTVGCPPSALQENAARLDAIMLASVSDVDALNSAIEDRKTKAICIGPGFGTGERLREFTKAILSAKVPTVLDADALTEYRDDPAHLFDMLHDNCVLTPHEGEFGRLFPDILAKLKKPPTKGPAFSKADATREAAARADCVVLFKGPDTVIADPEGRCSISSAHYGRAAPWLATAGSGDVLAGLITGLLARGYGPVHAAETASWLHVECARTFGPGLIAEDLPEQLPEVLRELGL